MRQGRAHGGNIQALALDGFPLWVSPVELGSVHDITAACNQSAAGGLADAGYDGAGPAISPVFSSGSGG